MSIFEYKDQDSLGKVIVVDTATVIVRVDDVDKLRRLQVNRLVLLQSSRPGEHLIGVVQRIARSMKEIREPTDADTADDDPLQEENTVRITLIGTHIDKKGNNENLFTRTLETVPEIDANCFAIEGDELTAFMQVIANVAQDGQRLELGSYTLDENAKAYLNGNKLFQRHAVIVGSTGSGKSWTTARVVEQVAALPNANAIVFDIHGEYGPLKGNGIRHLRIAGPGGLDNGNSLEEEIIYLPYWLLSYESIISMFVDRSDQNAPNQTMLVSRTVRDAKMKFLTDNGHTEILANFTIDSPIPFKLDHLVDELNRLNIEMVPGARANSQKLGDFHGKLSRLISRLENRIKDRRLAFMFQVPDDINRFEWLNNLASTLVGGTLDQTDGKGGVKIIDFSEVPSDVLPLVVSLVAQLVFSLRQWTAHTKRHPIALFCDEAHLYIPERLREDAVNQVSVSIFERVAKEGRKYGIGLVVISQRPSEVNRTVLSQCNNVISMRLTNAEDQGVIRRLLPDSLGGFSELLPILDIGEALVVGDASLLPSRIRVSEPTNHPDSGTLDFWDKWSSKEAVGGIKDAVDGWRKQTQQV